MKNAAIFFKSRRFRGVELANWEDNDALRYDDDALRYDDDGRNGYDDDALRYDDDALRYDDDGRNGYDFIYHSKLMYIS